MAPTRREVVCVGIAASIWAALIQLPTRSIGLFYDDVLVFRHYGAETVLRGWWSDLAVLTSPELWVHVYRPMTLIVHALTYEVFGFEPDHLLLARSLMCIAICLSLYVWVRVLEITRSSALFCALLFLVYPPNFYAFTWNTEIAAISSLVWLLLAFGLATRDLQHHSKTLAGASWLCWALALLTKEVVVPLVIVFPVLWLLCGRRRDWKHALSFATPFAGLTAIYLIARLVVLDGEWGAQGLTPGRGGSLTAFAFNYLTYVSWMNYDLPVQLARDNRLVGFPRPDVLILVIPLVCACLELFRMARRISRGPVLARLRQLGPVQKQLCLGTVITAAGGLICCLLPIPRVMFAAALGPVLLIGALPDLLRTSARMRREGVAAICVLVLGLNSLWYFDLVHGKQSDFVRLRTLRDVESYFILGHLFEQWDLREQAEYLRARLVEQSLLEPTTGRLRADVLHRYLASIGESKDAADETVSKIQAFKGAFQE